MKYSVAMQEKNLFEFAQFPRLLLVFPEYLYECVGGRVRVLTKQWRTKPKSKSILRRLRNLKSLTNTAAQLLHTDTAKSFYC